MRSAREWTTRQAAEVLLLREAKVAWIERRERGPALRYPTDGFGVAAGIRKVTCHGTGRVHADAFLAFRCTITYAEAPARAIATTPVYARIWSESAACVSPITLADCPPPTVEPALPGDPRCSISSTICMARAAKARTLAALRAAGASIRTVSCFALTAFHYSCIWRGGARSAIVKFIRGKGRWTITVHIAPPPRS